MTFDSCERWVAAKFLADLGLPYTHCGHPTTVCPPITTITEEPRP